MKKTNPQDYIGKTFGRLQVIAFSGFKKVGKDHLRSSFLCKCNCNNTKVVTGNQLKSGMTKSCGCLQKETMSLNGINHSLKPYNPQTNVNELYRSYQRQAIKRNLLFNLDKEEFFKITQKDCFYCGDKPSSKQKDSRLAKNILIYNGIDRINNNEGYSIENCIPCCSFCNIAKHHHSLSLFLDKIKKIYTKHYGN